MVNFFESKMKITALCYVYNGPALQYDMSWMSTCHMYCIVCPRCQNDRDILTLHVLAGNSTCNKISIAEIPSVGSKITKNVIYISL